MEAENNNRNRENSFSTSRRKFINNSGLLLAGITLYATNRKSLSGLFHEEPEPIIDIHQHLDYVGRDDASFLNHQKSLGATKTILLPAGRPGNTPSTHGGIGNGLEAEVSGVRRAYEFAQQHPEKFYFGANERPDYPHTLKSLEKYLKKGAVVIGEQKFGVDCDSTFMQKIYEVANEFSVPVLLHFEFERYNYD